MAFMEWSDELKTGINTIDTQHHWLVDLANRLYDAITSGNVERSVVGDTLENLMDYTMNHFIVEEELFHRHAYPAGEGHQELHDRFTARTLDLLHRHEDGETVGAETLDSLKDWLIHHIKVCDKAYVPFLLAKGVH